MVKATPFLLVLLLVLGAHSLSVKKKCNLTGQRKNDLGSNMTIYEVKENGDFTDTIAAFTGQCFVEKNQEVLMTIWLLRSDAEKCRDNWKASSVGYNIFKRLEKLMD